MKYIVKCRFCGRSFVVDTKVTGANFMCEACTGTNNICDVEERIQEKPKGEDLDIANIKSFDMSQHPVVEEFFYDISAETWKKKIKTFFLGVEIAIIWILVQILILG